MADNTLCGLFTWRPGWLQKFATKKVYLLVYSLLGIVQGMGNSYLSASLSTIEKQFGIKSSETAWIFSGNEISQIFFILVIPFLNRIKKRTLWTSVSMVFSAAGFFVCALPFLARNKSVYESGWNVQSKSPSPLCTSQEGSNIDCDNNNVRDWGGLLTIFFGFFIIGFGTSFYFTFGIPFVDDNVSKEKSPFMLGIISSARTLGPAMGSLMANACLKIYVIPGLDVGLKEGDQGWLGAWWLGFVIIASLTMLIAPILALFPERLPSSEETEAMRLEKILEAKAELDFKEQLNEAKLRLQRLGRNKIYVYSSLSTLFFLCGFMGFVTFIPKMMEYAFRQKASSTGGATGLTNALGSSIGILLSGYLIGRFKFRARTLQAWNVFVGFAAVIALFAIFQIQCPVDLMVYEGECNKDCACTESKFDPVCSADGLTMFYSPCSAGCRDFRTIKGKTDKKDIKVYSECTCAQQALASNNVTSTDRWWSEDDLVSPLLPPAQSVPHDIAVEGFCPADCTKVFHIVLSSMAVFGLLAASTRVGSSLITLRAVDPQDKSASLLLMVSLLSLFAFLPSPILVGKILDDTCTVWGENCGEKTTCLLYDNYRMRTNVSIFVGIFVFISTLFDVAVWYYVKDLAIFEAEVKGESTEMESTTVEKHDA